MLSFSTCWNSTRHKDGAEMLEEILGLGFENVELGHGIRLSLMAGVQDMVEAGRVRITSLHNFCPLPIEVTGANPDCYEFTSHRPFDVQRANRLTRQTIDFAARFRAGYVVLHLGRVAMRPVTHELGRLLQRDGDRFGREFTRRKVAAVAERERRAPLYLARAKDALLRAAEYAAQRGVFLGVEGRHSYEEVPTEREVLQLLAEINSPHVGYWHDFGHLQVKANLGFVDHFEWLQTIRGRLFGGHLHDVAWPLQDHRVPFTGGMVDYDRLIPLLPNNTLLTWELHPRQTAESIRENLARWRARFGPR